MELSSLSVEAGTALHRDVVRYASMGDHRTASSVDRATSTWICERLRAAGLEANLDSWRLRQFQLEACWVEVYSIKIDAFPLWHPSAAGSEPLTGRVVPADQITRVSGHFALAKFSDDMVMPTSCHQGIIDALARAGARAIIGTTPHASGDIYAPNVIPPFNQTPWPIPVVMISPSQWHVLAHAAAQDDPVALMLCGRDDAKAEAQNVVAKLHRGNRWIIVSTPQSGWFRSAGERGAGIALLLELARWAAASESSHSFLFLSNSGHEIGHMGIHHLFSQSKIPTPEQTVCWLHLGSSIATRKYAEVGGLLSPAGPAAESWLYCSGDLLSVLQDSFVDLPHLVPRVYDRKTGEIRWIIEKGYSCFALMGPQRFFHLKGDGPEVIDPNLLTQTNRALQVALGTVSSH